MAPSPISPTIWYFPIRSKSAMVSRVRGGRAPAKAPHHSTRVPNGLGGSGMMPGTARGASRGEPMAAFAGRSVVITGASSGIGRALALELAGQGARLALAARDAARLDEVAAACRARGATVLL